MILFIFIVPELSIALDTTFSSDYCMDEQRKMQTRLMHVSAMTSKIVSTSQRKPHRSIPNPSRNNVIYLYVLKSEIFH